MRAFLTLVLLALFTCGGCSGDSSQSSQRDTTPPVITLVGDDPQIIEACSTVYTELGAAAWDNVSGNLTASIIIDASAVDTDVHADYLVTYDVRDAAGNAAATVTRTVRVVLLPSLGDQLYGVDSGSDSLFLIDAATGAGCFVGRLDPAGDADPNRTPNRFATPVSMAIDTGGALYVINGSRCFVESGQEETECRLAIERKFELVRVDPLTGAGISISDPSGEQAPKSGLNTLALDPITNALYGLGPSGMDPQGEGTLTLINTFEGQGVPVGRVSFGPSSNSNMHGADFDACGNLYAVTGDGVLLKVRAEEIALADADIVPNLRTERIGVIPAQPTLGSIVFDRDDRLLGTLINGEYFEIDPSNAATTPIGTLSDGGQGLGFTFDPMVPRLCEPDVVTVDIVIGPSSNRKHLALREAGGLQVTVLTSDSFDATQVARDSVLFGAKGATASDERYSVKDVDDDGDMDVVLYFNSLETGIRCGNSGATLTGKTFAGDEFIGTDANPNVNCPK